MTVDNDDGEYTNAETAGTLDDIERRYKSINIIVNVISYPVIPETPA